LSWEEKSPGQCLLQLAAVLGEPWPGWSCAQPVSQTCRAGNELGFARTFGGQAPRASHSIAKQTWLAQALAEGGQA